MDATGDAVTVVRDYFDAVRAADFDRVGALLASDVVWHQPGRNRFSGTHRDSAAVARMIGGMMTVSGGTFELRLTAPLMANGDLVAAPVHFGGKRDGVVMSLGGTDLLRVADGRITEVWLFSADQRAEDEFWGKAG